MRKESGVHEQRLMHAEKDFDVVKISKESIVKQAGIQRQQLQAEVDALNQALTAEKDAHESLLSKYSNA